MYDENGDIDYEQVQNAVGRIVSGEYRIERLTLAGEEGRLVGNNRLLVGASLIVGRSGRAINESDPQKRRNQEEELLEAYARSQNAWIEDVDAYKRSLDRALPRQSEVIAYKDGDFVIKIAPVLEMDGSDSSILRFLDDKIALHNTLPHTAPYELIGFARDWNITGGKPTFQAVLRQPYITGEEMSDVDEAFNEQLRRDGFAPDPHNNQFVGNGLIVADAIDKNVIKLADGRYIIFDPQVMYQDSSNYQPMSLTRSGEDTNLRRTEETRDEFDAIKTGAIADIAKNAQIERTNDRIKINLEGQELLRRLAEEIDIRKGTKKIGDDAYEASFSGEFYNPTQTAERVALLRSIAKEAKGRDENLSKVAAQFADEIEAGQKHGKGTVVVYMWDRRLPHELFHQASFLGDITRSLTRRSLNRSKRYFRRRTVFTLAARNRGRKSYRSPIFFDIV